MNWCYAAASVIGLSHIRAMTRRQDAKRCFIFNGGELDNNRLFAIISDGAGSAEFGGQGASILCRSMSTQALAFFRQTGEMPDDDVIWMWLDAARDRIQMAAARRGRVARDFAATMVLLIASSDEVVTAHVGDGAIVARAAGNETWVLLSSPEHGEYASTTYFVTDDPSPSLRIDRTPNKFSGLALFSDGIENLVLNSKTAAPSTAFFSPMARPLDLSRAIGLDASLSRSLARFLASDRINERTDDDKTLIVAVTK